MSDRDDLSTNPVRVASPESTRGDSPSWSLAARLRRLFLGTTLTGIKWIAYSAAAAALLATVILAVLRGMGGGNSSAPARPAGARH